MPYRIGKIFIGRAEETEAHIAEALRLSPRDTLAYVWMSTRAWRSSTSAVTSKRSRGVDGRSRPIEIIRQPYFRLAAALAQLGRLDEAHSAVKAGLALNPTFAISRARARLDGDERRPDVSGRGGAHSRRPAQGRACRRNEASLKAACGSGCDARRLSTGRSIRA